MIQLTIRGTTYNYPEVGSTPSESWGEEASAWAQAVTETLQDVINDADILETVSPILNNVTTLSSVNQLSFDPSIVKQAEIVYTVRRTLGALELIEEGTMYILYTPATTTWSMILRSQSNGGITFDINSSGQVLYKSSNMVGMGIYDGNITFRAKTILS
jgi:hypothetical protein